MQIQNTISTKVNSFRNRLLAVALENTLVLVCLAVLWFLFAASAGLFTGFVILVICKFLVSFDINVFLCVGVVFSVMLLRVLYAGVKGK